MKDRNEQFNNIEADINNTNLLRAGVIFLSIVSFYTTANGMKEYIFINNAPVAYAASAAIQGMLLALSMNLPGYLRNIWGNLNKQKIEDGMNNKFFRFIKSAVHFLLCLLLCACAILLTVVILFCSSWFSYVYIADVIHSDSWGLDSELLVQQTYREQLYSAYNYADAYRAYLEDSVGGKILLLEEQAGQISDSSIKITVKWQKEREDYVAENTTTANSYMATVIDAMETAIEKDDSQKNRDIAAAAIEDAKTNIADRMENIQQNLNTLDANITNYNNQISNITNRINRATEGTDITSLNNTINRYAQLINESVLQQEALQSEYMQLDRALLRLPFYESQLGLASSTSAISIRSELMELQSEFFQQEPDEERMLEIATEVFENLRSASRTMANSEDSLNSKEAQSYTNLILQMNSLIQNLTDYSEIKEIELNMDALINDLRTMDVSDDTDASGEMEKADSDEDVSDDTNASEEMEKADSDNSDAHDNKEKETWKAEWRQNLANLKAQISSLPVYVEMETTESNTNKALSDSQIAILRDYDRNSASKALDDMTRRYISNHNEIYQGIIYLQSPYRSLAIFALILAASFDLSGFIFGVVIQGKKYEDGDYGMNGDMRNYGIGHKHKYENDRTNWSIIKTLRPYIVLTGDYENKDGKYYYKTFKEGEAYCWEVEDSTPYSQGIYIQQKNVNGCWKGSKVTKENQELCFALQANKPQDGIYVDNCLSYDEGSLVLGDGDNKKFITTIDEYVPIHSYNSSRGENRTIPAMALKKKKINIEIAVVALNEKGTRVVAVYIIEK